MTAEDERISRSIAYLEDDPYIVSLLQRQQKEDRQYRSAALYGVLMGFVIGWWWRVIWGWLR